MSGARIGHSGYLRQVYRTDSYGPLVKLVAKTIKKFKAKNEFDAILFRGSSGAAVAYPISAMLGIPIVHVRKPGVDSHGNSLEGPGTEVSIHKYIIIDDLIASGKTMRSILEAMQNEAQCIGIFLYNEKNESDTFRHGEKQIPVFYISESKERFFR